MPNRARRAARWLSPITGSPWFRVLGTALAVFLFIRSVDLGGAIQQFGHLDPGWTLLAIALAAGSVIASIAEWGVLLRGTGHGLDWSFLGTWYLKGLFVNQVLPAGVGSDAVRALRLGRLTGHGPMVASLVASRMAGTLGMSLWALAAAVLLRDLLHVPAFAGFVVFAFLMIVAWVLALVAETVRARIPARHRVTHAFGRLLHPFTGAFATYRGYPWIVTQSISVGTIGWGLNLYSMQAFALALGHNVSWSAFAVALPIALLAVFVPISANGIGVREGVLVVLLVRAHVGLAQATALSLFVDLQMIPFAVLGGMVYAVEHNWLHHPTWLVRSLSGQERDEETGVWSRRRPLSRSSPPSASAAVGRAVTSPELLRDEAD
jgi:uncharacterized protein (TIRG00374 family)